VAYREAKDASRLKDEFLATLSHEIRTPLNAVIGYTRMMRDGSVPPDRRVHALDIVERNAEVLRHLVEDVLDAARMNVRQTDADPSADLGKESDWRRGVHGDPVSASERCAVAMVIRDRGSRDGRSRSPAAGRLEPSA